MNNIITRLLLLVTMMIVSVSSYAYDAYIDGIYYNLNKDTKTAEMTNGDIFWSDYYPYSGNIIISPTITYEGMEYNVTNIGSSAFSYSSGLISVTIPSSVTSIGGSAFVGCIYEA